MELAQLRYFLKIVEHRNFTRAAAACHVSQPALSQQIGKLEKELGVSLFDRQRRVTRLTQAGKILHAQAEKILTLVNDVQRQITDDGTTGTVVVSTTPTVGPFLTTKLIHNLNKQFPQSRIQLTEEAPDSLHARCCNKEVDFAITALDPNWDKRLVCEPILVEEIQIVLPANHPLAEQETVTIEDIRNESLILMNKKQLITRSVERCLNEFGISLEGATRVEQFSTLQHLVALNRGISFVPRMAVNPKFKKDLAYKQIADYELSRTIGICWNEKRFQTQLAANMVKAVRELGDPKLLLSGKSPSPKRKKAKTVDKPPAAAEVHKSPKVPPSAP